MSASKRRAKREQSEARRLKRESFDEEHLKSHVLESYPAFPEERWKEFLWKAKWPGAVLRWKRNRNQQNVQKGVRAYIRHNITEYDKTVREIGKSKARAYHKPEIDKIECQWASVVY